MPRPAAGPAPAEAKPLPARPLADSRLGLKIGKIVIDPGHGATTTGPSTQPACRKKTCARRFPRLGKLLETRLGAM